jgi:hypothetical protein
MKLLLLLTLLLTSCTSTAGNDDGFDTWYEQVINEPYDPANGSKY